MRSHERQARLAVMAGDECEQVRVEGDEGGLVQPEVAIAAARSLARVSDVVAGAGQSNLPWPRRSRLSRYGYRASTVVVTRPVTMSYTWPETLTLGESSGEVSSRSTSALTVMCGSATAVASSAVSEMPVASAA